MPSRLAVNFWQWEVLGRDHKKGGEEKLSFSLFTLTFLSLDNDSRVDLLQRVPSLPDRDLWSFPKITEYSSCQEFIQRNSRSQHFRQVHIYSGILWMSSSTYHFSLTCLLLCLGHAQTYPLVIFQVPEYNWCRLTHQLIKSPDWLWCMELRPLLQPNVKSGSAPLYQISKQYIIQHPHGISEISTASKQLEIQG